MISDKALKEFIEIYQEELGIQLDEKTAMDLAISLLVFFKNVHKPIKKVWLDEYQKNHKELL
ncbi:MAG: hypothetical protein EXS48_01775 [Candidatus Staskawiczbacteria bacterium]|nr:hypothetical protein [Candidatus Staskawiczbacteria bacterium]